MSPQNLQTLLDFFKALSNESRLKLLGILAQRECSVEELAALLDLKPPTVSHHLAKLKALNLVSLSLQGNTHLYRLNLEQLQYLSRDLLTPEQMQTLAQDVEPKNWETTVLQSFIAGDRITSIPVSRKKRFVLLKWLVEKFECDRDYSEKEVNTILKRHHEDCATLRREFIGYQLMTRDRDVYRRLPETEWLSEDGNFN
ncbi:MAG TPA: ArsR family transcriptional regulator [Cyanobacteria bacterium UBA11372]|nr:ArsR family transcriptional regulator [Cyanobacteria bacterium UBA11372]